MRLALRPPGAARARPRARRRPPGRGRRGRRGARRPISGFRRARGRPRRLRRARARLRRQGGDDVRAVPADRSAKCSPSPASVRRIRCRSSTSRRRAHGWKRRRSSSRRACASSIPARSSSTSSSARPPRCGRRDGEVSTVAADGAVIDELRDARLTDLPFVVGDGANERLPEFISLLDGDARSCGPRSRPACWSTAGAGTCRMKSGLDVKLPETDPLAAVATLAQAAARIPHPRARHSLARSAHARQASSRACRADAADARAPKRTRPRRAPRHDVQAAHAAHAADPGAAQRGALGRSTSAPRRSSA